MARRTDDSPSTSASPTSPRDLVARALRRERSRRGMSSAELARQAGVAKSTLSQLENGQGNPSLEVLWALSRALEIPFARLTEPDNVVTRIVRRGDGPRFSSETSAYVASLLATIPEGARGDLYLIEHEPGSAKQSDAHTRGTVEHIVLMTGRALVGPAATPVELAPGDYVVYAGDAAHVFEALEPGTTAILLSEQR